MTEAYSGPCQTSDIFQSKKAKAIFQKQAPENNYMWMFSLLIRSQIFVFVFQNPRNTIWKHAQSVNYILTLKNNQEVLKFNMHHPHSNGLHHSHSNGLHHPHSNGLHHPTPMVCTTPTPMVCTTSRPNQLSFSLHQPKKQLCF